MKLIKIDNQKISDQALNNLNKMCLSASRKNSTEIYIWHNDKDIISVFVLKDFGYCISTEKELDFGINPKYENYNYAKQGLKEMINMLKKRSDIKKTYISTFNKKAITFARELGLEFSRIPEIISEEFNPKFDYLCNLIKDGVSENKDAIIKCCSNNKVMLKLASIWVKDLNKYNIQNTISFNLREQKTTI